MTEAEIKAIGVKEKDQGALGNPVPDEADAAKKSLDAKPAAAAKPSELSAEQCACPPEIPTKEPGIIRSLIDKGREKVRGLGRRRNKMAISAERFPEFLKSNGWTEPEVERAVGIVALKNEGEISQTECDKRLTSLASSQIKANPKDESEGNKKE
jgi:hypothetical protein